MISFFLLRLDVRLMGMRLLLLSLEATDAIVRLDWADLQAFFTWFIN
jgi:hypothetical protein